MEDNLTDYIKDKYKDSSIILEKKTDSSGRYKFVGLPLGEYDILEKLDS